MTATEMRIQLQLIIICFHNVIFNVLFFHTLRRLYLRGTGSRVGKKSYIHINTWFTRPGRLLVGEHTTCNPGCYLDTRGGITLGNNVMLGHRTRIYTAGHDINAPDFRGYNKPVVIGNNVVIFPNCIIMPGVEIGEGAVIFPGSVVTKLVEPFAIMGGNPARYIKERNRIIEYKLEYKYWFPNA